MFLLCFAYGRFSQGIRCLAAVGPTELCEESRGRDFVMSKDSDILFELDWMPDHAELVRAFTELFGRAPRPPAKQ
jgi:hypothetical protein